MKKKIVILVSILVFSQMLAYILGLVGLVFIKPENVKTGITILNISKFLTINQTRRAIINSHLGGSYVVDKNFKKGVLAREKADKYFKDCNRFIKNDITYQSCVTNKAFLGLSYYVSGDFDNSLKLYNEALTYNRDFNAQIAQIYILKDDYKTALEYAKKSHNNDKTGNDYALLSLIYRNLGNEQKAYNYYKVAIKLAKNEKALNKYQEMYSNYKSFIKVDWQRLHDLQFANIN